MPRVRFLASQCGGAYCASYGTRTLDLRTAGVAAPGRQPLAYIPVPLRDCYSDPEEESACLTRSRSTGVGRTGEIRTRT